MRVYGGPAIFPGRDIELFERRLVLLKEICKLAGPELDGRFVAELDPYDHTLHWVRTLADPPDDVLLRREPVGTEIEPIIAVTPFGAMGA